MPRIGGHWGVWLAAGLWAAAAPLNIALVAATVAPPAALPVDDVPEAPVRRDGPPLREDVAPPETVPEAGPREAETPPPADRAAPRLGSDVRILVHKVAPGDVLISVTRDYLGTGARWREVAEANDIPPPYVLEPGTSLRIPMARQAHTEAHLGLVPPPEPLPAAAPPAVPVDEVNLDSAPAFIDLDKGLRISRPLAEAYPWEIPFYAALAFAGAALAGAALAVAGVERRIAPARALRSLFWGATAGGGACALVGGVAILAAGAIAGSALLQLLLAAVAGGSAGTAAWFAAKSTPGAEEPGTPAHALAARFGRALGWLTASSVAAAAMAGWLSSALKALWLGT